MERFDIEQVIRILGLSIHSEQADGGRDFDIACRIAENALRKYKNYKNLEEQGLLLKLPCKVGTKVCCIMTSLKGTHPMIFTQSFDYNMIECFGKTVFLTQAEAEEALKKMENK